MEWGKGKSYSCFEMEKSFEERVAVGKGEVGE